MYNKKAGVGTDVAGVVLTSLVDTGVNLPIGAGVIGDVHGLIEGDPGKKGIKDIDNNPRVNLLPGAGHSNMTRRLQRSYVESGASKLEARGKATSVVLNKRLTPLLLSLAGTIAGGMYGQYVYNKQKEQGVPDHTDMEWTNFGPMSPQVKYSLAGAGLGLATGYLINMVCSVAGALSDKKSKKETKEDMNMYHHMLIPGYGSYELSNQVIAD